MSYVDEILARVAAQNPNEPEFNQTVQEVLGHENLNTTQIYTHIESTELKIAAEANPLSKLDFSDKIE